MKLGSGNGVGGHHRCLPEGLNGFAAMVSLTPERVSGGLGHEYGASADLPRFRS